MQSEKAAVIRRRRHNLKNPEIMPALVCRQRLLDPITVTRGSWKDSWRMTKKLSWREINTNARYINCSLFVKSNLCLVWYLPCTLYCLSVVSSENGSGEIKKMLISYPVEKLVRKERKRRRILYMRWSVYWKLFRRELRWLTSPWRKGFLLPSKSWKQLQNKETTGLQIKISTASCVSWIRILLNNAKQQAARPAVVCFYVLHPLPYCC